MSPSLNFFSAPRESKFLARVFFVATLGSKNVKAILTSKFFVDRRLKSYNEQPILFGAEIGFRKIPKKKSVTAE